MMTPVPIVLAVAQRQLSCLFQVGAWLGDPTHFALGTFRIDIPGLHGARQLFRTAPVLDLHQELVVLSQQPVDVSILTAARIAAHNRVLTPIYRQIQHGGRGLHQLRQTFVELPFAIIQTIHQDFSIACRQHAPQLSAAPLELVRKVTTAHAFAQSPGG